MIESAMGGNSANMARKTSLRSLNASTTEVATTVAERGSSVTSPISPTKAFLATLDTRTGSSPPVMTTISAVPESST
ncbi:hypothetical protein D9M68_992320 [compost metagenome]